MYELWLAANIAWEIAMAQAALTLALALAVVVLVALALVRGGDWRRGWRWAWTSAAACAAVAAVVLPRLSGASWSELTYVVDWAMLAAIVCAVAVVVAALVWPLAAALRRRSATRPLAAARATG